MIAVVVALGLIVVLSLAIWKITGLHPGYCPVAAIASITGFIYFFGLNRQLVIGAVGASILAGLSLLIKPGINWSHDRQFFTNPGIIFFVGASLFCILTVSLTQPKFDLWDEVSHWGPFYRYTFYAKNFPVFYDSNLMHVYYLQGVTSFYYFFSWWQPQFSESLPFITINMLIAAGLAAVFSRVRLNHPSLLVWLMIVTVMSGSVFHTAFPYYSIYVDFVMGVLFGAGLVMIFDRDYHRQLVWSGAVMLLLSIVKDTGLILSLLLWGLQLVRLTIDRELGDKRQPLVIMGGSLGLMLAFRGYWSFLLQLHDIPSVLVFTPQKAGAVLTGFIQRDPWYLRTAQAFIVAFMGKAPIIYIHFKISILAVGVGLSGLGGILAYTDHSNSRVTKGLICFGLPMAFLLYEAALVLVMITAFPPEYGRTAPSFDRFSTTYIVGWWLALLAYGLTRFKPRFSRKQLGVIHLGLGLGAVAFVAVATGRGYPSLFNLKRPLNAQAQREEIRTKLSRYIQTFHPHDRIWLVSQKDSGFRFWLYHLELMPTVEVAGGYIPYRALDQMPFVSWSLGPPKYEGDTFSTKTNPEEWMTRLQTLKIKYVMIDQSDAYLESVYGELFSDELAACSQGVTCVYQVNTTAQRLIPVLPH